MSDQNLHANIPTRAPDLTISFSKTVAEDPAVLHARLRRECPVALQVSDGGPLQNGWLVTRYEDIAAVARDTETFAQSVRWPGQRRPPLESDPPEHRDFRALMQPFFMPASLAKLEPLSRQIAVSLLKDLLAAGGGDFAHGLARPLPPQVLLARMSQPLEDCEEIKRCCEPPICRVLPILRTSPPLIMQTSTSGSIAGVRLPIASPSRETPRRI